MREEDLLSALSHPEKFQRLIKSAIDLTKNKPLLKSYYDDIKSKEPIVNSPISHKYHRAKKELGAVPTINAIFKK